MTALMRVAIYARARYSGPGGTTDPDSGIRAATAQLASCHAYAAAHSMTIAGEYTDLGVGVLDERPHYDRLIAELAAGHLDAIIAEDGDRLVRSFGAWEALLAQADSAGCQVHLVSLGGPWDKDTVLAKIGYSE